MKIKTGDPSQNGLYVAYVQPSAELSIWPDKMFLSWYETQWYHTGSDQKYRGEVFGHLGPLPSMRMRDLKKRPDKKFAIAVDADGAYGCFVHGPFNTVKEATELIGDEGEYIVSLIVGKEPKLIRRWSDITSNWERLR